MGSEKKRISSALILTGKFGVGIRRRGCGIDEHVWVRPSALLEAINIIAQDIKVGIEDERVAFEFRVINGRTLEQFNGDAGKDHVRAVHLVGEAGELIDLLGAEVGLHVTLKKIGRASCRERV